MSTNPSPLKVPLITGKFCGKVKGEGVFGEYASTPVILAKIDTCSLKSLISDSFSNISFALSKKMISFAEAIILATTIMAHKILRKKTLKFRDFPTRYRGDVFFVESGYDEKLNLSIINHLVEIQELLSQKYTYFNYFPFIIPKNRNAILYHYPAMDKEQLNFSAKSDMLLPLLVDEKEREKFRPSILELDHEEDGIYYVNAYPLSIESDEELMPWM